MKIRSVLAIVLLLGTGLLMSRGFETSGRSLKPDLGFPVTGSAAAFALSQAAASVSARPIQNSADKSIVRENGRSVEPGIYPAKLEHDADGSIGRFSALAMPTPLLSVDGLTNFDNIAIYNAAILPPDVTGDVGPLHYVQAENALVRIYDKNAAPITGPFKLSDLFAPLGTACSARNDGDPIVLYDPLADRWLISQYCTNAPPFRQLIAISTSGDPTLSYYLYEFVMPNIRLNDFPKFGVWPDGYYMSTEEFTGSDFTGMGAFAFDRAKMLAGNPDASYIYFSRPSSTTTRLGNLLPADLDGLRPPPTGSPNTFSGFSATEYGDAQDAIRLFDFHADFTNPLNSTFAERPESPIPVSAFDPTSLSGRADIAQPAPGEMLDANSDRLNYRAAYRNFGASESLVFNQTVRLSTEPYRAGVRVYELKKLGSAFVTAEQSTIGETSSSRWIGNTSQDGQGNLAISYNHVSDTKQPSIYYSGKLANEPTGTFRDEAVLVTGTGVQKAFGWRWGDYGGLSVDPVDDCTFWVTGEYYSLASEQFSDFTWLTRIGKFKFPECSAAQRSVITGSVTNATNGQPIANASVKASAYSRFTGINGGYGDLAVLPGTYTVTAAASGFRPQSFTVSPANGQTLTQDFVLEPVPVLVNSGVQVAAESCGANSSPDPGETVTINVSLQNTGSLPTQHLIVSLLAAGGVADPGPAQVYGAMPVNGTAVTRPFTFTVAPNVLCGSVLSLSFQLNDGNSNLGQLTLPMQTGVPKVAFQERFDRSPIGFLPLRWSRNSVDANGAPDRPRNWAVSAVRSESISKSLFSPDINQIGFGETISPAFRVTTTAGRLTFRNWYDFETTFLRNRLYDGSLLEIKIGGGNWQDIIAAGGIFESGGYDGLLDSCCQNPLRGRLGWSGRSGINETPEFITTSVRLPATAAGQMVQLRWLVGTDVGGFREGQYIDNLLVTDGFACACSAAR